MVKLYKYGFLLFFIITIVLNNQQVVFQEILKVPKTVFDLVITLTLSACLWSGLLQVIKASGMLTLLTFLLQPILKLIYNEALEDDETKCYLSTNFLANLLGLGALASVSGLNAMRYLQKNNPYQKKPSKTMVKLVVINTTGLTFLPTTMMMLRSQLDSQNILVFYPSSLMIGITITILGVILVQVLYGK